MLIDDSNYAQGNRALAWVLLLYYHLLRENGFTHDQTVYIDAEEFNAFAYVAVEITLQHRQEIDQLLLRQGAVVYLLCELNDMICDHEADYLAQSYTQKILAALGAETITSIPEVAEIVRTVTQGGAALNQGVFQSMLRGVFETYVVEGFKALSVHPAA
ncbi:MAG: hypothetical protein ABWY06_13035 [Pseudomonas sp.]|uniref:hypothetical protein n=1 Tax=Pseudomonas sp. TaxID=306 RepID=UPI0033977764